MEKLFIVSLESIKVMKVATRVKRQQEKSCDKKTDCSSIFMTEEENFRQDK